jgi:hypothetical protein
MIKAREGFRMSNLTDKTMDMLRFNHYLTKKYTQGIKFGIGNCFADLVFIVSELNNEFIYLFERLLPLFDLEVSDVYITPFYKFKTQNKILLTKILQKEMSITQPHFIVIADDIEFDMPETCGLYERIPQITEIIKMERDHSYDKKVLIKKQKYVIICLREFLNEKGEYQNV